MSTRSRSRARAAETPMIPHTKARDQMQSSVPLPPPSVPAVKDNEYERCREERIRENMEIMQKLGLSNLSRKLREDHQKFSTPRRRSPKTSVSTPVIRGSTPRRSSRLQSVSPVCYDELGVHNTEKRSRTTSGSLRRITELVSKDEVYTEEHDKLLGSCDSTWTLFVDGCGTDGRRIYDPINGKTCHQCRQKTLGHRTHCNRCEMVTGQFCGDCLYMRYGENVLEAKQNPDWICPVCRGICNCSICRVKKGWAPTGSLYRSVIHLGYKSVAHYLIQTRRGQSLPEKTGSGDPVSARKSLPFEEDEDKVLMLEYAISELADTKRLNDVNELQDPADSTISVALQCQEKSLPFEEDKDKVLMLEYVISELADTKRLNDVNELQDPADSTVSVALQCQEKEQNEKDILVIQCQEKEQNEKDILVIQCQEKEQNEKDILVIQCQEKEQYEKDILVTPTTNLDDSSSLRTLSAEGSFKYDDAPMTESAAFVISAGRKDFQSDDENEICYPDKESTVKESMNTVGVSSENLDSYAILEKLPKMNGNVNPVEAVAEVQPANYSENQHLDIDELPESLKSSSTINLQCQQKLQEMNGRVTTVETAVDSENLHNSRDELPESLKSSSNVVLQCQGELLTTVETVAICGHVSTSLRKRAHEEDNPTTEENSQNNPLCELTNDSNISPSDKENNVHGPEKQVQNSVQKRQRKLKDRRPPDFTPSPDCIAGRLRKRQWKH